MNDPIACLRLARTQGVGPVVYRRLLARFGSAEEALRALPGVARQAGRETPPLIPSPGDVAREIKTVAALGGRIILLGADDYPSRLAQLDDAPAALTVLGDVAALSEPCIAIVGSRNASANGRDCAWELGSAFARAGFVVVSGLARGIDAAAHRGALAQGRSVAAIAGGIDQPYPPENTALQASIAANGCVVAEAPFGTAPIARHFPRRNRIIAGLAIGVVVVEAALQSGSLITARLANEAGREVFAVPGNPRDARAAGCNRLLREGAIITESATDVLDHLAQPRKITKNFPHSPGAAEPQIAMAFGAEAPASARLAVIPLLGTAPTLVDDLVRHCQLSPAEVHAALMDLELAGRVERLPGNRVALLDRAA